VGYKGYSKLERILLENMEAGEMGLLEFSIYAFLMLKANSTMGGASRCPPGVWIGSARAIRALAPRQAPSERAIQRSLVHLEKVGRIKRWVTKGKRGNYPIMIAQHPVGDLSGRRYTVNAEATEDWRNPKLDPVDGRSSGEQGADTEPSTNKETRSQEETKVTSSQTAPHTQNSTRQAKRRQVSEAACRLADRLRQGILFNNPKAKITDRRMQQWAEEADRMMRMDERSERQIAQLIDWSQHDSFWRSNILSMGKLREKFDQLMLKSTQARGCQQTVPGSEGGAHGTSKFSRIPRVQ
jgi:hypothetical protein